MITKSVVLACGPERAWRLFTEHASEWWPETRRHTSGAHSQIRMVPGGRFWERGEDGREVELGRVRVWDAPRRLLLDFYPGTDPDHPTEVTVTFEAVEAGAATLVTIVHGPSAASAELWKLRAARFEQSWDLLLPALADFAQRLG